MNWREILPCREVVGAENEESWLNTKLWPSCEAQCRQRKADPDSQFCHGAYINGKKPRCNPRPIVPTQIFVPQQIFKYSFIIQWLPNEKRRSKTAKRNRNSTFTCTSWCTGPLSHRMKPCTVKNGLSVPSLACHRIQSDGEAVY